MCPTEFNHNGPRWTRCGIPSTILEHLEIRTAYGGDSRSGAAVIDDAQKPNGIEIPPPTDVGMTFAAPGDGGSLAGLVADSDIPGADAKVNAKR